MTLYRSRAANMSRLRFDVSVWVMVTMCVLSARNCWAQGEYDPSYWNQQAHDLLFEKKDYTMQKVVSFQYVFWSGELGIDDVKVFNMIYISCFDSGSKIRMTIKQFI